MPLECFFDDCVNGCRGSRLGLHIAEVETRFRQLESPPHICNRVQVVIQDKPKPTIVLAWSRNSSAGLSSLGMRHLFPYLVHPVSPRYDPSEPGQNLGDQETGAMSYDTHRRRHELETIDRTPLRECLSRSSCRLP